MESPTTEAGLRVYDQVDPAEAVRLAWTRAGSRPQWHREMQDRVRREMPVLARALDRLALVGHDR